MSLDPLVLRFPLAQMTPQSVTLHKAAAILSGPSSLAAPPQTVQSGAGRWGVTYRNIRIATPQQRLVARAALSRLTSPLRPVYVSPLEWLVSPRRLAAMAPADATTRFSDGASFSDGAVFDGASGDFAVAAPALAGATEIFVACNTPGLRLQGGQIVSLDERMHQIEMAHDDESVIAGGQRLTLWPPLRVSLAALDPVESENPLLRARLDIRSAEMAIEMASARYAYFDLAFVEDDWTL